MMKSEKDSVNEML